MILYFMKYINYLKAYFAESPFLNSLPVIGNNWRAIWIFSKLKYNPMEIDSVRLSA